MGKSTSKTKTTSAKASSRKATTARKSGTASMRAADGKLSCRQVVTKVLAAADGPMKVNDIADAVLARNDHRVGGQTPKATIAAELAVGAKPENGRYVRTAPGTFAIAEAKSAS